MSISSLGELRSKVDGYLKLFGINPSDEVFESVNLAMVGATSVGKSRTINALVGREVCGVGHVGNTTRKAGWTPVFLSQSHQPDFELLDLPGWGVSRRVDNEYRKILGDNLPRADAVLWILRADSLGTLAYDLSWISDVVLPALQGDITKLVVGINQVENVYDYKFANGAPSKTQVEIINEKCRLVFDESVVDLPGLKVTQIQPYSAAQVWRVWPLLHTLVAAAGDNGWIFQLIGKVAEDPNAIYG